MDTLFGGFRPGDVVEFTDAQVEFNKLLRNISGSVTKIEVGPSRNVQVWATWTNSETGLVDDSETWASPEEIRLAHPRELIIEEQP